MSLDTLAYAEKVDAFDKEAQGEPMPAVPKPKPSFEEVHAYASQSVNYFLRSIAKQLPHDQKEEIFQNAMLRVWQAYQNLDPDKGWKSFVQLHCKGAVQDYIKLGHGAIEDGVPSEDPTDGLRTRVEIVSESAEGSVLSVEDTVAHFGVANAFDVNAGEIRPKWPLINRMIVKDEGLHIIAKVIYGWTQEEIADQYSKAFKTKNQDISRERVSQRIQEFIEKLDSVIHYKDPWVNQCIFALGLCERYHMQEHDNGLGWDLDQFDVADINSFKLIQQSRLPSLFDFAERPN